MLENKIFIWMFLVIHDFSNGMYFICIFSIVKTILSNHI
jgi:hypothetical protein